LTPWAENGSRDRRVGRALAQLVGHDVLAVLGNADAIPKVSLASIPAQRWRDQLEALKGIAVALGVSMVELARATEKFEG
jgi:hypothetical protein